MKSTKLFLGLNIENNIVEVLTLCMSIAIYVSPDYKDIKNNDLEETYI